MAMGPRLATYCDRVEIARSELYPIPLEVCVADTQAGMGYMIAQCVSNVANRRNLTCDVTAIVTTVLVDPNDPAFKSPDKAIGPGLTEAQADQHRTKDGWQIRDEGKGRFRRVVPSPLPRKIIELPAIDQLVNAGQICGLLRWRRNSGRGGRIASARIRGVAAVIDKDRTTGLLARHLQAANARYSPRRSGVICVRQLRQTRRTASRKDHSG